MVHVWGKFRINPYLFLIPWAGGTRKLDFSATLNKSVTFGAYVAGDDAAVEGTLKFQENFQISTPDGQFKLHEKISVEFEVVTILNKESGMSERAADHYVFAGENEPEKRIMITEKLMSESDTAWLDHLIVSKDLSIGDEDDGAHIRVRNGLTVKHGPL